MLFSMPMNLLQFCRSPLEENQPTVQAGVEYQGWSRKGRGPCRLLALPHPLHSPAFWLFSQSSDDESCFVLCIWPLHTQVCLDCSPLIYSTFFLKPNFLCELPLLQVRRNPSPFGLYSTSLPSPIFIYFSSLQCVEWLKCLLSSLKVSSLKENAMHNSLKKTLYRHMLYLPKRARRIPTLMDFHEQHTCVTNIQIKHPEGPSCSSPPVATPAGTTTILNFTTIDQFQLFL